MALFSTIDPDTAARWLLVPGDWRRPDVKDEYEILWDRERSFGQIWPRPQLSEVLTYYEVEDYYTHGRRAAQATQAQSLVQRLQTKISWLADKGVEPDTGWWLSVLGNQKLRILEIGCGHGANLTALQKLGHSVFGVEPDPAARAIARDAGHEVYDGTAEDLPSEVSGERFDVIIFMHVLEHCIDPFDAIRSAVGVLKEGGTVVAEVPNNECRGAARFGIAWHWLDVPRHLNFFTSHSLCELFRSAELHVEDVTFRGFCRQFSPGWKSVQSEIASRLGLRDDERPKELDYWHYLAATMWSGKSKKYDSVRVVGRRR